MSQDLYNHKPQKSYDAELHRQLENTAMEVQALINDYRTCSDDVCRSQIKTFLEKKEHLLLDLQQKSKEELRG